MAEAASAFTNGNRETRPRTRPPLRSHRASSADPPASHPSPILAPLQESPFSESLPARLWSTFPKFSMVVIESALVLTGKKINIATLQRANFRVKRGSLSIKIHVKGKLQNESAFKFYTRAKTHSRTAPIGCAKSPFSPRFIPFGTSAWLFRPFICKVHSGKGLSGRPGGVVDRLVGH